MAGVASTEAPLKRKIEASSEAVECKKARECSLAVEAALVNSQEASVQSNGDHKTAGEVNLLGEAGTNARESTEESSKNDGSFSENHERKLSAQAPGSSSASLQDLEAVGEGEVLEQDDGNEEDDSDQLSGLDTENESEDEGENEDDSEDDEDDASDSEEDEEPILTSSSSSLQAEAACKDKGKAKVDDLKGKSVMPLDKGKGKAIAEDETAPVSDEDDAGYLSEDPLEEVDLNNILPTRTRRRSSTQQYEFVEQGDDDDDDDEDSDA